MKKKTNKAAFYKVETSPRLRMRLPLACYLAALLLWMTVPSPVTRPTW